MALGAAPTVAATATPNSGNVPLTVFFDSSGTTGATSYQWDFGDGGSSTAPNVTHTYTVAGTYTATLTAFDAQNVASAPASLIIAVNGPGAGSVTPGINSRIAPTVASFKLNRAAANSDSFKLRGVFNTVDLPTRVTNLAANISINHVIVASGILNSDGEFFNPAKAPRPNYFVIINTKDQQINISIARANLGAAFGSAPSNISAATASGKVDVTVTVTIGANSYEFTQKFDYVANANGGTGTYDLSKGRGDIGDGFFVISKASAIEVPDTRSHFFEFEGYLALPKGALVDIAPNPVPIVTATEAGNTVTITTSKPHKLVVGQAVTVAGVTIPNQAQNDYNGTFAVVSVPSATSFTYVIQTAGLPAGTGGFVGVNAVFGNWVFTFNEADKVAVPVDGRIFRARGKLVFVQPDRQLGGIHTIIIDPVKRTFSITTWDIRSNENIGGTGLPTRGEAFTSFDFTLRFDLDLFDDKTNTSSTLSVVTATQLTRKTTDDAFWQTGRKQITK
jgi:PKD repeat protein